MFSISSEENNNSASVAIPFTLFPSASILYKTLKFQSLEAHAGISESCHVPVSGCTRPRSRLFSAFKTLTLLSGTLIPHPRLVLFNSHGHSKSNVDTGAIDALAHNVRGDTRRANKASGRLPSGNFRGGKDKYCNKKKKKFAKKVKRAFPQAVFLVSNYLFDWHRFTQVHGWKRL